MWIFCCIGGWGSRNRICSHASFMPVCVCACVCVCVCVCACMCVCAYVRACMGVFVRRAQCTHKQIHARPYILCWVCSALSTATVHFNLVWQSSVPSFSSLSFLRFRTIYSLHPSHYTYTPASCLHSTADLCSNWQRNRFHSDYHLLLYCL